MDCMETHFPSADTIRATLEALSLRQVDHLSELSGVPVPTLHKIRYGQTPNPRIETVGKFMPFVRAAAEFMPASSPSIAGGVSSNEVTPACDAVANGGAK